MAGNNALLQLHGRSIWLKDLNDPALVPHLFDYAQAMLDAGTVLPVPDRLRGTFTSGMSPPPDGTWLPFGEEDMEGGDALDPVDPVCLMDVDPATARRTVEYDGRSITFCAPSCKKLPIADPSTFPGRVNPSSLDIPNRAVPSAVGSYIPDSEAGTVGARLTRPADLDRAERRNRATPPRSYRAVEQHTVPPVLPYHKHQRERRHPHEIHQSYDDQHCH